MIEGEPLEQSEETPDQKAMSDQLKQMVNNLEIKNTEAESPDRLKDRVAEKAEQFGVPILTEKDIDERLGDKPYATHTIVSNQENVIKVLNAGKLQSSEALGGGAMTYEADKLIGMDKNVFFALGKGYMRTDTYSLIFDPEILAQMPDASFVEDDLAKFEGGVITEFLEENSKEIVKSIEQNRDALKESFRTMVEHAFEGEHGIYEQYFGGHARDRVQDFLDAIDSKGFKGVAEEKEVVDQFTILSNAILSEKIMPPELRSKLQKLLEEKVIKPHTVTGAENIHGTIDQCWKTDAGLLKEFLPGDKRVPDKVVEIRVPNEADIRRAIIGIYVPTAHSTTEKRPFLEEGTSLSEIAKGGSVTVYDIEGEEGKSKNVLKEYSQSQKNIEWLFGDGQNPPVQEQSKILKRRQEFAQKYYDGLPDLVLKSQFIVADGSEGKPTVYEIQPKIEDYKPATLANVENIITGLTTKQRADLANELAQFIKRSKDFISGRNFPEGYEEFSDRIPDFQDGNVIVTSDGKLRMMDTNTYIDLNSRENQKDLFLSDIECFKTMLKKIKKSIKK